LSTDTPKTFRMSPTVERVGPLYPLTWCLGPPNLQRCPPRNIAIKRIHHNFNDIVWPLCTCLGTMVWFLDKILENAGNIWSRLWFGNSVVALVWE